MRIRPATFLLLGLLLYDGSPAAGGDWPQWRYDAGRGAVSPDDLPATLHLAWSRQLPEPRPAWPESQPALRFDASYSPVAAGGQLFVPSMVTDSVTAYDIESGAVRWRFYADGPVRLAPIVDQGRVYFGSDDGHLYCLDAADGRLLWRVRGGPSDRRVLGNERLISTWPVRGGPVLLDGRVYFSVGVWSFMGVFVHAVDAATGETVWTNSGESVPYTIQPHNSPAFAGFIPRGHMAATSRGLVAPGGRTQPGCYDLATGRLFGFSFGPKSGGTCNVSARGPWFFATGVMRAISDGRILLATTASLHDATTVYGVQGDEIFARSLPAEPSGDAASDAGGKKKPAKAIDLKPLWTASLSGAPQQLFLKAGKRFYAGEEDRVAALEVDTTEGNTRIAWEAAIEGTPWTMLAAADRLVVVTAEGRLYCFGEAPGAAKEYGGRDEAGDADDRSPVNRSPDPQTRRAKRILAGSGATEGYCVVFGAGSGRLPAELVRLSGLHVIVIEPEAGKVDALRRRMTATGLYGGRIAVHAGRPESYTMPPYLARLAVVEAGTVDTALVKAVFHVLRPYGGTAWLPVDAETLKEQVDAAGLAGAVVRAADEQGVLLVREGALPGAADWTHQYADAANTVVSQDRRVKAPLGLLWFGGPPNDEVLPRHGHGPSPQVAAGRLVIEGPDMLRSLDIYTGRLLWQRTFPKLGEFYDNTSHQPGAGEIGSNYVTMPDAVYVAYGAKLLELDAATGETVRQFAPPDAGNGGESPWGFVAAWDDLLVGTVTPVAPSQQQAAPAVAAAGGDGAALESIIPPQATWRYLAGSDPPANWADPDFDDKAWKSGQAGFGYGDDDDRTVLEMKGRFARVYLRKEFDAKDVEKASQMSLVVNYDDALIAYLNGKEVVRVGVGRGQGKGASAIKSHEAKGTETFLLRDFRKLLRPGKNVLAIEGHNVSLASSDFTLDPYLAMKSAARSETPAARPSPESLFTKSLLAPARYASASRRLVVYDRHSGKLAWQREAEYSFRHNNIAIGDGKLFCIDGLSEAKRAALKRRGVDPDTFRSRLLALDVRTGREIWSTDRDVFGTFLNYSAEEDVLLQSGSASRDRASDESAKGMVAYRGSDGQVLWKDLARPVAGPCMLHGATIITQQTAYSLRTGEPKTRPHPLTGEPLSWTFTRNYGCNTAIACQNLITFRSAAAGFFDLATDGGTGNLGGFKSSCTSNLIAAGGLLCAPEYTRTCTCPYQNQSSLAMIYDPEVEQWTFNAMKWDGGPVRRVGINFAAPGDRMAADGTLWLDWPSEGGPSPDLPIEVEPDPTAKFRRHSSLVRVPAESGGLAWVAASGLCNVRRVKLTLSKSPSPVPRRYTVRLHFAEPDAAPGERVFAVRIQGKEVLARIDVAQEAGPMTALVKQFRGVEVTDALTVDFVSGEAGKNTSALVCGIEAVAEGW